MTRYIAPAVFALAAAAAPVPAPAAESSVCVTNGSAQAHFFVAEARGGARETGWLGPTETLCAAGAAGGVVSVFESDTHEEGCSRLVPGTETETLIKYVDFDRCFWSSNTD